MFAQVSRELYFWSPHEISDLDQKVDAKKMLEDKLNSNGQITIFRESPVKNYEVNRELKLAGVCSRRPFILDSQAILLSDNQPITLSLYEYLLIRPPSWVGHEQIRASHPFLALDFYSPHNEQDLAFVKLCIKQARFIPYKNQS